MTYEPRSNSDADQFGASGTLDHGSDPECAPSVMAADALKGDTVLNSTGEKLGTLEKIVVDVPGGRIAYVVLSSDGDKLLPIPWRALTPNPENGYFVLDISKEQLEQAPRFDKDHWPSMSDSNWAREVHAYYRALPYYWS